MAPRWEADRSSLHDTFHNGSLSLWSSCGSIFLPIGSMRKLIRSRAGETVEAVGAVGAVGAIRRPHLTALSALSALSALTALYVLTALSALFAPTALSAQISKSDVRRVDSLLDAPPFNRHFWGVALVDDKGKLLYARNADRLFVPASNTKLVVSAVGSARLAPDWTVTTSVYGSGTMTSGTLDGGNVRIHPVP